MANVLSLLVCADKLFPPHMVDGAPRICRVVSMWQVVQRIRCRRAERKMLLRSWVRAGAGGGTAGHVHC